MWRISHARRWCAVVAAGVLGLVMGCQTASAPREPAAAPGASSSQPADALTPSDTSRAQAAIKEDRWEMSGERRPADPGRDRVVDQPRVGDRR